MFKIHAAFFIHPDKIGKELTKNRLWIRTRRAQCKGGIGRTHSAIGAHGDRHYAAAGHRSTNTPSDHLNRAVFNGDLL